MRKQLSLCFCIAMFCFCLKSFGQPTTQGFGFSAFSSSYSSISTTGTAITSFGGTGVWDFTQTDIPIGFTFNYCGVDYTQLSASTDGWVSLANSPAYWWGAWYNAASSLPMFSDGAGFLFPYWDYLPGYGRTAYYTTTGSAPNRIFTMEWYNWTSYYITSGNMNVQVKLYEGTNVIDFLYGSCTFGTATSASIGIANTGTDYRTLPNSGTSPTPSTSPSGTFTSTITACPASGQVYRWTPCPVTVTAANSGAVCPGGTVTLTGTTSGTSYTWTGPGGFSSTLLNPTVPSFVPSLSGTYTLTATNGTCTNSATTIATHLPISPVPVITPSVAAICNGATLPVTATASSSLPTTLLTQNFNTSLGGWTTTDIYGTPASFWQLRTPPGYASYVPGDGSQYLEAAPNATGGIGVTHTIANAPSFSTVGYTAATLEFNQWFYSWGWWGTWTGGWGDLIAAVQYSTDGGSSWSTFINQVSTTTTGTLYGSTSWTVGTPSTSVALPAAALGMPNVRLRWNFDSYWGYWWAIDNVKVTGVPMTGLTTTWSPATNLFTDAAATVPYTLGAAAGTVYVHPTTITATTVTTYTASVATSAGCVSSATSIVTVNPAVPNITGAMTACTGYTTTLSNTVSGGTWTSTNTAVATVGSLTGIVTGVTPGTATIFYTVSGCSALTVVTVTAFPSVITGVMINCMGATTTLSDALPGGTWSSSNTAVATVGPTTGIVSGVSLGTTTITYSMGSGCQVTAIVTVNPFPNPITGSSGVCLGATTPLSSTTPGGVWTSSAPATAGVGVISGIVSGLSLGTSIISYRVNGCSVTRIMTVVAAAAPITGPTTVCTGYPTITLTDLTPGGSWSSSNTSVATVSPVSGEVTGVSAGTSKITYAFSAGCLSTLVVTVIPAPAAVSGELSMCQGQTSPLTHPVPGGTWSSGDPTIATVGLGTGIVTGLVTGSSAAGTATITYILPTGCAAMSVVTVNPLPAAIGGTLNVCEGGASELTSTPTGGVWTSSNPGAGTVDASSGIVAGIAAGTTTINYTIGIGCSISVDLTVNPLPATISGPSSVCVGNNVTFSSTSAGGAWMSSDPALASVSATGSVAGVAPGLATITYALPTGCQATKTINVQASPAGIAGSTGLCLGYTTTLADASPGGTWSSSAPSVATVGFGLVSGLAVGTSTISYTLAGCSSLVVVTVNSLPAPIGGTLSVCVNGTTSLTETTTGGTWSTGTTTFGTINATSGVATGIAGPGTTTVTYTLGSGGCYTAAILTVNALPAISGSTFNVCNGAAITLTGTPGGGTWSSSTPSVATVGLGTGIVTGGSVAVATPSVINYTLATTGCANAVTITVNPLPAPITGTTTLCVGNTTTLSSATTGVTWTSSNTGVAGVLAATGAVTGNSAGTATITCYGASGCYRTTVVLVNPLPSAISGPAAVCEGSTVNETSTPGGGTWSSTATAVATVGLGSGVVSGLSGPGTTTVIYTAGTGCAASKIISVNPIPAPVTGNAGVCIGMTTTLNGTPSGGTWNSGNTAVATIGVGTGIVTGMGTATATATITYTLATGCRRTVIVTVYALPGAISGPMIICANTSASLGNSSPGGTWSSSNTAIATMGVSSGIVTGISGYGTSNITYTLGSGCTSVATLTVNPQPASITGTLSFGEGANSLLTSAPAGGTWSSSNTAIGTIDPATGVMYGVAGGTTTVTYVLPTGCRNTQVVTVNALPGAISGGPAVCAGGNITLTCTPFGGTWSSSNTTVADVNVMTGVVSGHIAGTTNITYTLPTGTIRTTIVTVQPMPAAITGATNVCVGATTTLTDADPGGTWSSSNPATASIGSATGVVTGIVAVPVMISYTLPTGCRTTAFVIINPLPDPISGTMVVCENATTALTCTTPGGTWSVAGSNASVNSGTGAVTGLAAGTAVVTYNMSTGCTSQATVTINPLPALISGQLGICIGANSALSDATTGGFWTSGSPLVAPITPGGVVSAANTGNTVISYTQPATGCTRTAEVTVNPLPAPITGSSGFCNLSSTTMADASPGGTWSCINPLVAVINPTSGVMTGVTVDTVSIIYTLPTGCSTSKVIGIILAPFPLRGDSMLCLGQTTTLSDSITGGTWTSSAPGVASIDFLSGVVNGVTLGTAHITYVLSTGCYSALPVTVNANPGAISGQLGVCTGLTATVSDPLPGGTWSSSTAAIGTIDALTGVVTGIAYGTTTLTYTMPTGCKSTGTFTVNPLPGPVNSPGTVCEGSNVTLTDTSAGGTWVSGAPGIAYASLTTGVVTGTAPGTARITYTLGTGCIATTDITVNAVPFPVTGIHSMCVGDSALMNDASPVGVWVSSNPAVAGISPAGMATGISAGISVISYVQPTGCAATLPLTVNPNPAPIAGSLAVCAGFATNLTDATAGGTWSADPMASIIGTIHHLTGVATGITPGLLPITYTLPTGCKITNTVTVILLPAVISGPPNVCVGQSVTLSNPIPGGTWSSSNTARATVDVSGGVVTGIAPGSATITYMVGTGCFNVLNITVNPLPAAITGPSKVCEGATITLADASTPGVWISSNTSVATIGFLSGIVSGVSGAPVSTVLISYTLPTGCIAAKTITVDITPPAISGSGYICQESTVLLSNTMGGGVWSSSSPAVATIGASTGIVSPVTLGTSMISYTMPVTGCRAIKMVTVSPLPLAYNVTGGGSYCSGGNGVHIGLDGSQSGVSYVLYYGSSATGYAAGSGSALDFGLLTMAGAYSVAATYALSGCMKDMNGSTSVVITPLHVPTVQIVTGSGDSSCPGNLVTLSPVPTYGGTAPSYLWKINGVSVSTGNTYSFVPANGDVASVIMNSNGSCILSAVASGSKTLTVLPYQTPAASLAVLPGDTVCQYSWTTFSALPSYGGSSPLYSWFVNGVQMSSGSGATYGFVPQQGDDVRVRMVSNYLCRLVDAVNSSDVVMTVDSLKIPHVSIVADPPSLMVSEGQPVTLRTIVTDAGAHPSYQWKVNGHPVPGATEGSYISAYHDYDSITCIVVSDGVCRNIGTFDWVFVSVFALGVQQPGTAAGDVRLIPNPNNGSFKITGTLASATDEELDLEITDVLGQVVYKGSTHVVKGRINAEVTLDNTLANGMYLLNLRGTAGQTGIHFVITR